MNRFLFAGLIFLVLLTSTGDFSQNDFPLKTRTEVQLVEEDGDSLKEFRETIKFNLPDATTLQFHNFRYDASQLIFKIIHHTRYSCYLQRFQSKNPADKLFIDFGKILI